MHLLARRAQRAKKRPRRFVLLCFVCICFARFILEGGRTELSVRQTSLGSKRSRVSRASRPTRGFVRSKSRQDDVFRDDVDPTKIYI